MPRRSKKRAVDNPATRPLANARMRTVYVSEYPAIQHRHGNGDIVTVRLKRGKDGVSAACPGCQTVFVYRKPVPSSVSHHKSPLLPPVKGNWDSGDD
jgi:hypothetical protein